MKQQFQRAKTAARLDGSTDQPGTWGQGESKEWAPKDRAQAGSR